jgi:hypothetical protein
MDPVGTICSPPGYRPVPLSVTVTEGSLMAFEGITRVAFFAPALVGLNLTHTARCTAAPARA